MDKNTSNILSRFEKAKSRNMHFDSIYEEAYRWFMPDKENRSMTQGSNQGNKNRDHIFDNTAEESINTFASRMSSLIFPYNKKWFNFSLNKVAENSIKKQLGNKALKDINTVLEEITEIFFNYLNVSNFYPVINESLKDYGIGTGSLIINETTDPYRPFLFDSINPNNIYIEESFDNRPRNCFREFHKSIQALKDLYPDGNYKAFEETAKDDKDHKLHVKECFVYDRKKLKDSKEPYELYVFADDKLVFKKKMNSNPYIVFRYNKLSEEIKGRGPALMCVDDVKVLNEAIKSSMKAAEKSTSEIFLIGNDSSLKATEISSRRNKDGTITLEDDLLLPVENVEDFKRLGFDGSSIVINDTLINRLQFGIKNKMIAGTVERSDSITRAPEEIMAINSERAQDLNAQFARVDLECMQPTVERIVDILLKKGLLDTQMESLTQIGVSPAMLSLSYNSPISRAQDVEDVNNFIQATQMASSVLGPEKVLMGIDSTQVIHDIYEKFGVNSKWFLAVDDVKKILQQQQEQQQQMIQQAQQQQQPQEGE